MKFQLNKLLFLLATASKSPLFADAQLAKICESMQSYGYDSGHTTAASTVVSVADTPWIQLDLTGTELAPGAILTITSDSTSQELTADSLAFNAFSGVFDGSQVNVELSSNGGIRGLASTSRVRISNVKVGLCRDEITDETICGDIDDRVPSEDVRMGRIGGCTGWLISEDVFIQAGHCGTPSSSTRIHFVYGTAGGPLEDQYAVEVSSYTGVNGGVGNDWGVGRLLPNSETGMLPGVAQSLKCGTPGCGWFELGSVPTTTTGNNIRITGYGTAAVDSRSQKTHVGPLVTIAGTYVRYRPDTTGGNSGSPVVHEETGKAIGVHTHGGCSATGGSNQGTRIDKPEFAAAIEELLGAPCSTNSDCDDGVFCNGVEVCNAGKCRSGTPVSCDDGIACTLDICNEDSQQCENPTKACDGPGENGVCLEPSGQCECSDKRIEVDLTTDNYPTETSWTVSDMCSGSSPVVVLEGGDYGDKNTLYSKSTCAVNGQYRFTINDEYGDGICCSYGSGSYLVKYGGNDVASGGSFGSSETKTFGECGSDPTPQPTSNPTAEPTNNPTAEPTNNPTAQPTNNPTAEPTNNPTAEPTNNPTAEPTNNLTPAPTNGSTSEIPTVSPTVGDGDDASPQNAAFDSTYGAPRCADAGSSCDSLELLDGRGTMTNGNEENRPNTNKFGQTCNDGNGGSYHSDESIDQIAVFAGDIVDGTPVPSGDFIMEGGRAYVSARVWCWNTGASDSADIYITSDASSPDWQLLTTITCPGGGEQTISHAFDVPYGTTNQSVRVNFRYKGSPSTCSNGSWDDHDDLIFTVKADPNSPTPSPTPPPTAVPTNAGPSGPQTATYDSSFGVPKCSFGSSCDSGGLLDGRGTINNGVEPHRPNTLDSCTDGNSGSYHSDESIDKIVVARNFGTGDLTEGDLVTITATVYCWGSGTSDYIDFYSASDASNPNWQKIGQRKRCPGSGLQNMSVSYNLPQGATQAVRANFMYGSGNPGVNKCTPGKYDDTDDLVITVKPNPSLQATEAARPNKNDDVQGEIVYEWKDAEVDEMMKDLQELNLSAKKPKLKGKNKEKGKGKGGGKGKKSKSQNESRVSNLFSG